MGFPSGSAGKESACNVGDLGSISGSERFPREGVGCLLPYSWASLVDQLVKNPPQCGRPGFDLWFGKIPWRRERLPSLVFLPGESHGQRSLVSYSPWYHQESDTTERLTLSTHRGLSLACGLVSSCQVTWATDPLGSCMQSNSRVL